MEQNTTPQPPGVFPVERPSLDVPAINSVTPLSRPWSVIFAVAAVFISIVAVFVTYFMNVRFKSQIKASQAKIASVDASLSDPAVQDTERLIGTYVSAISGYQTAAAQQLDYSYILGEIDQRTPKDIQTDSISIDDKNNIRITETTNSFVSVGKALLSFRKSSLFSQVSLSNTVLGQDGNRRISFTLTAALNKAYIRSKQAGTANQSNDNTPTTTSPSNQ